MTVPFGARRGATRWLAALSMLCGGAVHAQQHAWQPGPAFMPLGQPALAYDSARQRMVMVLDGGLFGELWEGDGAVWRRAAVGGPLAGRQFPNVVFDRTRNATLVFGGAILAVYQNDLWSWNGAAWAQIAAAQAPPPRNSPALVFDPVRARLVLYGGYIAAPVDDTWEFDGATWVQQFPANRPTARLGHSLVFDEARATTLLFGGYAASQSQSLAETWSWDGVDWTRRFPAQSPPPRRSGALAYDSVRGRVVLYGGGHGSTIRDDTWEWDGANWSQVITATRPESGGVPALGFDAARREMVQVTNGIGGARTWAYDTTDWRLVIESTNALRENHAIAYDPRRDSAVCFGGAFSTTLLAHTWEFRGGYWRRMQPSANPSPREFPALAFDPTNQDVLLFGGRFATNETWSYDGVGWTRRVPAVAPPARYGHAMATDTVRRRVVLFGGQASLGSSSWLGDTWEWDGANWLQRAPLQSPPARSNPGMAYDPLRNVTSLYGGGALAMLPSMADHWEWDGTNWTQRTASAAPGARARPGLVFDEEAGRVVLFGGYDQLFSLPFPRNDTWEFDGSVWLPRATVGAPPARNNGAVAWLSASRSLLLNAGTVTADTWLLRGTSLADVAAYGSPCSGAAGMPSLSHDGLPVRGNRWFELTLSSVPATAPVALGLAAAPTNVPVGGGCFALVNPALFLLGAADARGANRFALPIPNSSILQGVVVHAQGLAIDGGGSLGGLLSLSAGLRVVVD